jgi:hypothetical protein
MCFIPLSSGNIAVFGPTAGANESIARQIVGLAAQQDQIERRLKLIRKDRRRLRDGHVATRAADDQSGLRQLFGAARPHQKCHVAAGLLEPTAEIAAKRARADYQNAHHEVLYAV